MVLSDLYFIEVSSQQLFSYKRRRKERSGTRIHEVDKILLITARANIQGVFRSFALILMDFLSAFESYKCSVLLKEKKREVINKGKKKQLSQRLQTENNKHWAIQS